MNNKTRQWRLSTLAMALLVGLSSGAAQALSMGRVHVLSALGEPLQAEIDILDINATEASTLRTTIAAPEAFKAAGLDYNPALANVQLQFARRGDGRAYLQLKGRSPVNEPFIDMVLEVRWASGRIIRDYTMLFDPPNRRTAATQASPAVTVTPLAAIAPSLSPQPAPPKPAATGSATPARASTGRSAPAQATPSGPTTVRIRAGDTAGKVALRNKSADISLEQMLLALLRANPDAFIDGNVNLIKAGALVKLPSADEARKVTTAEARRLIRAQSKDFNQFRQNLATTAPASPLQSADRRAQGEVQAQVVEPKASSATPDKLTLTQGTLQGKSAEDHIAQANNQRQVAQTAQSLAQNVEALDKLAQASQPAGAAPTGSTATAPAAAPAVAPPPSSLPAVIPVAPAKPQAATAQTNVLDELLANPMLPAAGGGLLALLLGWAFYRSRQRKEAQQMDSVLHESSLEDDSFFGRQSVHPAQSRDNPPTGSSMFYSASQIDSEPADASSEASVYMAYGRDQQAEAILKEALRDNPDRLSIHRKLLDIYAQRQDATAFEQMARLALPLTQGKASEWAAICAQAQRFDADNPLYTEGGDPSTPSSPLSAEATPLSRAEQATDEPAPELDFDLDAAAPEAVSSTKPTPLSNEQALPRGWSTQMTQPMLGDLNENAPTEQPEPDHNIDLDLDFPEVEAEQDAAPAKPAAKPDDSNLLEFDLGDLSLDLPSQPSVGDDQHALEAKLAQAEALEAQGDHEGARALIQEVIANASGDVKAKANDSLNKL